ncbi:TadE/TadG family type IV pilus assembly protein [Saccharopolyspora sp. NPDC003752]
MNHHRRDAGSASVELAVLTPMLLALLVLVIAAGRVVSADNALEHATTAAARSASLARTPTAAHTAAADTGTHAMAEQHLACAKTRLHVDTSMFGNRAGQPGRVTVTLSCAVRLSDLTGLPGLPGTIALQARFASPVDPYRTRS